MSRRLRKNRPNRNLRENRPDLNPDNEDQDKDNEALYGMGRGLLGNATGERDIEQSIGDYTKDPETGVGLTEPVPTDQGEVPAITKLIKRRPRAGDAPGAIVPYRRDEALFGIIGKYGDKLYEAPIEVLHMCASLLLDVPEQRRFQVIRHHFESHGIKNMPTWEEAQKAQKGQLNELYGGHLGIGGGTRIASHYPMDRPGAFVPGKQKRTDKGFTFYVPKPPSRARRAAGKRNAKKIGGKSGGMQSRMAKARKVLDTLKKDRRKDAGKKNGDRMRGASGPDFRRAGGSRNPIMRLAAGKYDNISNGKVVLKEGYPLLENDVPWFHGTVKRDTVGGVPCIVVQEGHIICSDTLPRPTYTEGYQVWDCQCPLGGLEMEVAFAQLTEGMETIRPWLKQNDNQRVLGLPTEGLIVRYVKEDKHDEVEFLSFDSQSGYDALQEWMVEQYAVCGARKSIEEAVTYGYVRAGASDMILDRVIRKLNRLNILDVFEDALFDTGSESLYVLMSPTLEETEIQEVALGLQNEYPDVQILGGPLDEDLDWWVLYIPKPGSDAGPDLDRIFEPSIARPFDVATPDIIGQAVNRVAMA